MKTWITSDLHFGHGRICQFCPDTRARFKNDVDYMNEAMVTEWNELIEPRDTVYILGDVAFLPAVKAAEYLNRLNGSKILVEGNHDRKALRDPSFRRTFKEIHKYLDINYDGHKIILMHYPILEWDGMHRGALHFHGHLHGNSTGLEKYRILDVGMDATGVIAISMEEAISRVKDNEIKQHH